MASIYIQYFEVILLLIILNTKNMSVKFKVVPRKNPRDLLAPEKFYANAVGDGEVDLDTLAEMISLQCTVTEADCYAVLISLERNIITELQQGRIVKLGKLGNFQVGLSSEGLATPQEVTAAAIIKSRIRFRPGKRMRSFLRDLSYRKSS
jgi:predicted histone-like DNA-binding protein